jgi:hypothetical protein
MTQPSPPGLRSPVPSTVRERRQADVPSEDATKARGLFLSDLVGDLRDRPGARLELARANRKDLSRLEALLESR